MEHEQRGPVSPVAMLEQARALVDGALVAAGLPPALPPPPVTQVTKQRKKAEQIQAAFGVVDDDEKTILRALRDQSPDDIAALRAAYRERFGESLDEAIGAKLGGEDLDVARFLLQGERRPAKQTTPAPRAPDRDTVAARDASSIFAELDAVDSNEEHLLAILAGKSADEAERLRTEYRRHHGGRDLEESLDEALDDDEMEIARAHLSGQRGVAAAVAMQGDDDAILPALRRLSLVDQAGLMVELARRGEGTLDGFLADHLDGAELDEARALARGDRARAEAAQLDAALHAPITPSFLGGSGRPEAGGVAALLEGTDDNGALARAYAARTGHALDGDLAERYADRDERRLRALAKGDAAGAAAIDLEALANDPDKLVARLEGLPEATRRDALLDYEVNTGRPLQDVVDDDADAADSFAVHQAATFGVMRPEAALYWSMVGLGGTQEGRIEATLDGLSAPEAAAAARRYEAATGEPLDEALRGDLSGDEEALALLAAEGKPATVEDAMDRADAEWELKRGSGAGILSGVTDAVYDAGDMMDLQHGRLADVRARLATVTSDEERRALLDDAEEIVGWQRSDRQTYQAEEARVAQVAGTAAQLGVTLAVSALPGGGAAAGLLGRLGSLVGLSPVSSSLMAASLAGGVAGMGTRRAILGEAYGAEAAVADAAMTAAQVASAGIASSSALAVRLPDAVANMNVTPWAMKLASEGLTGVASAAPTALVGALTDESAWEGGADDVMDHILLGLLGGGIGGVASGQIERLGGGLGRGTVNPWRASLQGAAGSALGSVAEQVVQPGMLDGTGGDIAERLFLTALPAAVHGGLGHYGRARQRLEEQPRVAMLSDASPQTHGVGPELSGDPMAHLADRRAYLREAVDQAMASPGILRRDAEPRLFADLTRESMADVEGPTLSAKRQAAVHEADERLRGMSVTEHDERLRSALYSEADARAARQTDEAVRAELQRRNAAYVEETYGRGATSGAVDRDPATGAPVLAPGEADALRVAAGRRAAADPVMADFAVVGSGLPAAATLALRQQTGDGRGLVIAEEADLWARMGEMPIGQPAAQLRVPGLAVQPGDVAGTGATTRYAAASELALASSATLLAEDAHMLTGRVVAFEARPIKTAALAEWPEGATGRMLVQREVPVAGTAQTRVEQVWVYSRRQTDIAGGMGEPRTFAASRREDLEGRVGGVMDSRVTRIMSVEDQLENLGTLRGADGSLDVPEAMREHGVAVQSGGASSTWGVSELTRLGVDASWIARETPPGEVRGFLNAYGSDREIAAVITSLSSEDDSYKDVIGKMTQAAKAASESGTRGNFLRGKEGADLKKRLARVQAARDEQVAKALARLDVLIAAPPASDRERLALMETREKVASKLDPFEGAGLPRNHDIAGMPSVDAKVAEVVHVEPAGEDKVRLYLSTGEVIERGRLLTGIGQTNAMPREVAKAGALMPSGDAAYHARRMTEADRRYRLAEAAERPNLARMTPEEQQVRRQELWKKADAEAGQVVAPPDEIYGLENPAFRILGAGASPHTAAPIEGALTSALDKDRYLEFWRARTHAITEPDSHGVAVGIRTSVHDRPLGARDATLARREDALMKELRVASRLPPAARTRAVKKIRDELNAVRIARAEQARRHGQAKRSY